MYSLVLASDISAPISMQRLQCIREDFFDLQHKNENRRIIGTGFIGHRVQGFPTDSNVLSDSIKLMIR